MNYWTKWYMIPFKINWRWWVAIYIFGIFIFYGYEYNSIRYATNENHRRTDAFNAALMWPVSLVMIPAYYAGEASIEINNVIQGEIK